MMLPITAALVLFAACSGFWYWLSSEARAGFLAQQARADAGTRLTCAKETWGGYPFRVVFECVSPVLSLKHGRTKVTSKRLTAFVRVYNPRNVLMKLDGPTVIEDLRQAAPVEVMYSSSDISVYVASMQFFQASGRASPIAVRQNGTRLMDARNVVLKGDFSAGRLNKLTVDLIATGVSFESDQNNAIVLDRIAGILKAANAPQERAADFADWLKAAARAETRFEVETVTATMGDTELTGHGDFQIGTDGYLTGKLKTRLSKLHALLSRLQKRSIVSESKAKAAGSLLGLFDRGKGVQADLHLKQGEVFWGPLKLGRHTPLF